MPLDSAGIETVVDRYLLARYQPAMVLGNATPEQVSRLEEHRATLPGLVIQPEPRRIYPHPRAMAHLVGYIGEVTQSDLDNQRYAGARLGSLVGRSGLEQEYDDTLRGVPGMRYIEVDARGRLVREQGAAPPLPSVPGRALHTTVDLPLQMYIDSIWPPGQCGAMIAMTPDGQIRALYSAPTYDPNQFVGGISSTAWRSLNTDPSLPLLNRAIQVRYPPGSPFKLATAAMALRRGLVDFKTHMPMPCRGGLQFGNRFFKCWKKEGHGSLDLVGAITQSCDVYFYQLGLRLGLDALLEDGVSMGFGDRSGIDLANESRPIYPPSAAYYDRTYGPRGWSNAVTLNLAIGQGENTQTLINMVQVLRGAGRRREDADALPGRAGIRRARSISGSRRSSCGAPRALIAVVEHGTARQPPGTIWKWRARPARRRTRTARTTAGSSASRRRTSPQIIVGASWSLAGTAPSWRRTW